MSKMVFKTACELCIFCVVIPYLSYLTASGILFWVPNVRSMAEHSLSPWNPMYWITGVVSFGFFKTKVPYLAPVALWAFFTFVPELVASYTLREVLDRISWHEQSVFILWQVLVFIGCSFFQRLGSHEPMQETVASN